MWQGRERAGGVSTDSGTLKQVPLRVAGGSERNFSKKWGKSLKGDDLLKQAPSTRAHPCPDLTNLVGRQSPSICGQRWRDQTDRWDKGAVETLGRDGWGWRVS